MEVKTLSYNAKKCSQSLKPVVRETLFKLSVNGRELLTLAASPHQPEQLVTGFLYLQGMISSPDDLLSLGACPDSGQVVVSVRGEIAETTVPTLTSGCGGGITFENLEIVSTPFTGKPIIDYSPEFILEVMSELFAVSEQYSRHGGIHSAALCDETGLLLHAEDIGRHNTVDRVAGIAIQQDVDTAGKLLLTSGRVSSELAVKAARLGLAAVASRTSPTDLAIAVCEKCCIGLAGYVRGGKMEIYANPERFGV